MSNAETPAHPQWVGDCKVCHIQASRQTESPGGAEFGLLALILRLV